VKSISPMKQDEKDRLGGQKLTGIRQISKGEKRLLKDSRGGLNWVCAFQSNGRAKETATIVLNRGRGRHGLIQPSKASASEGELFQVPQEEGEKQQNERKKEKGKRGGGGLPGIYQSELSHMLSQGGADQRTKLLKGKTLSQKRKYIPRAFERGETRIRAEKDPFQNRGKSCLSAIWEQCHKTTGRQTNHHQTPPVGKT